MRTIKKHDMSKITTLILAALLQSQLAMLYAVAADEPAKKPNVIVILADDQGSQDIGCQGAVGIKTPRIDQMAKEGIQLTGFYVTACCSPTRASLMTGRHPQRYGISSPINDAVNGLPPKETTLAELLKTQGYATGLIGKWHLGLPKPMSPVAQGFDYFSGLPLSQIERGPSKHDRYYKRQWRIMDATGRDEVEYNPCEEQFTQRATKEALAFIERNQSHPFFLYLAEPMVHTEVVASPDFIGKSQKGVYGDACQELDWSVGQILDKLKALGLDKRTLVVYTSDNGATQARNSQVQQTHLGSNLPFRGYKFQPWEGGSRMFCIVRWPGRVPAGRVSDEITDVVDFFPTFAAVSGAKLTNDRPVDGVNLWPFLSGATAQSGRRFHVYAGVMGKGNAVRVGPWKLVNGKELFNLASDPSEKNDVAAAQPAILKKLKAYQTHVAGAMKADRPLPPPPALQADR
jgi:arylsulfatase A